MVRIFKRGAIGLLVAAWVAVPAIALVPGEIDFQGLLLDSGGAPVNGSIDFDFELFDAASGGSSLWSESHTGVQVVDGVYDVTLGSVTPLTPALFAGGAVHLEITVGGETLSPRERLVAVPYALNAATAAAAESVGGIPQDFVASSSPTSPSTAAIRRTPIPARAPPTSTETGWRTSSMPTTTATASPTPTSWPGAATSTCPPR